MIEVGFRPLVMPEVYSAIDGAACAVPIVASQISTTTMTRR